MNFSSGSSSSTAADDSFAVPVKLIMIMITFVISVIGNAFVMTVVKRKIDRSVHDLFIVNLSISDVLFVTVSLSSSILVVLHSRSLFFCTVIRPLPTMTFCLSIFTIASMAILRCRTMCYPRKPRVRRKTVYVWIFLLWFLSALVSLPAILIAKVTPQGACAGNWTYETHKDAYIIGLLLLKCVLPLVIITGAYVKIGVYLVQNKPPQTRLDEAREVNRHRCVVARRENVLVVKMLATIVLLFGLCTSPHQIAWMLRQFGNEKEHEIATVIFTFSSILQNIHACVNPFIYGIMSKQFREDYMKIFAAWLLDCPIFCRCFARIITENHPTNERNHQNRIRLERKDRKLEDEHAVDMRRISEEVHSFQISEI